jgi:hypothetical protein
MGNMSFINKAIERKMMDLHCGYIGKVISTDGLTATVQPLGQIKGSGGPAKTQAIVSNVPVACRYKFKPQQITDGNGSIVTVAVPTEITNGDLVACLCADRDITEARRGNNELPPSGRHSISDSIIVGIL